MDSRGGGGVTMKYKLVLFGDAAVGKTSLVLRFVKGSFSNEPQEATIGVAFQSSTVCLPEATVKFEIWDTAGSPRYQGLAPMYYRGAHAALVVFDITDEESFAKAKSWIYTLQTQVKQGIVLALAGNKADLKHYKCVDRQKIQAFLEENDLLFMETSAKTAQNVANIFRAIATKLVTQDNEKKFLADESKINGINTTSTSSNTAASLSTPTLVEEEPSLVPTCCSCCLL